VSLESAPTVVVMVGVGSTVSNQNDSVSDAVLSFIAWSTHTAASRYTYTMPCATGVTCSSHAAEMREAGRQGGREGERERGREAERERGRGAGWQRLDGGNQRYSLLFIARLFGRERSLFDLAPEKWTARLDLC
jgi:hypothetical protein